MPHRPSHLQLVVKVAAALSMAQALANLARNTAQHGLFHVNSVTLWDTLPKYVVKRGKNNTSQTLSNAPTTTGKNGKTILSSHMATSLHTHGTAITDTTSSWLATMTDDEKQFTTSLHTANSSAWSNSDRPQPHGSNLHHKILIPNMEWDHAKDRFTEQRPKPLPTLRVQITPLPSAPQ